MNRPSLSIIHLCDEISGFKIAAFMIWWNVVTMKNTWPSCEMQNVKWLDYLLNIFLICTDACDMQATTVS